MKKLSITFICTFLLAFVSLMGQPSFSFGQTEFKTEDPVVYSNFIVGEQEKIGRQFIEFSMVLINSNDAKSNEQKRVEVVREIELGLRRLRNMAPFKGGSRLRNEAIAVFEFYKKLHDNEYARLAVLVANKESSMATLEEYFGLQIKTEKEMRKNAKRLQEAQQKFAETYQLGLSANPMQQQFDRILESNIYSREVFLGYIGTAKLNEAWWDAMQEDQFEEMEKMRIALIDAAKLSPLREKGALNGDTGFRDIALARITWYGNLAEKEYKTVREILMNNQRSAEDVAYVNEVINAYNTKNVEQNQQFNQAAHDLKTRALEIQRKEN